MIVMLNEHIRAYNAFTGEPIPGVAKANTDTMTLTVGLPGGPVISSRARQMNFYLRVADDAPDDVKRQYPLFVDPQFAAPPLPGV